jgi:protein-disulfide isomerase|tara:strand:- start:2321 stop:2932 length:612 start_codon:yes stop_codon:yes gene_type:complete
MYFKISILSILYLFLSFNLYSADHSILKIQENDFYIGEPEAPVTIIEYASMSCSHCADFHNETLDDLKSEYIDTGKVKFVFRDFPFNYPALAGSMILSCVPEDVRYDYMNALYKLQKNWVMRDHSKTRSELYKIMQSGGMQQDEFDACLSDINLENDILEGVMNAQREFNINRTPSFIVNGIVYSGNKNIKEFRQIIDKILSQ